MSSGYAENMLVDEELIIAVVDRVVQAGPVLTNLHVLNLASSAVERERVADLGGHSVADALLPSGVRQHTGFQRRRERILTAMPTRPLSARICRMPASSAMNRALYARMPILLGRREEARPDLPRNGPAVRVDRTQLFRPWPRGPVPYPPPCGCSVTGLLLAAPRNQIH